MTDICRHCGKVILRAYGPEPYWYHHVGQTVYCDLDNPTTTTRAEPKR